MRTAPPRKIADSIKITDRSLGEPGTLRPAMQIVRALRGEWYGRSGIARCPAHSDRIPSLSVSDEGRKVLVHCHAGCDRQSVVSALYRLGLWPTTTTFPASEDVEATPQQRAEAPSTLTATQDLAVQTWLATSQ